MLRPFLGRLLSFFLIFSTIFFVQNKYVLATIYYVDKSGSDSNSGLVGDPWLTIQKAANTLGVGDTVFVQSGTYPEQVTVSRPSMAFEVNGSVSMNGFIITSNNISVNGYNVTGLRTVDEGFGFKVSGDNCRIINNYIHDTVRDGVLIEKTSDSCSVLYNTIVHPSQSGIEFRGTNHLIEGNDISDTIQYPPEWTPDPGYLDSDGIRFFGSGTTVKGNYIHDIVYDGVENVDPHIDCFQTWYDVGRGNAHDIVFDGNRCILANASGGSGTTKGFQIAGGIYNLTIKNNVIHAVLMAIVNSLEAQTHNISFIHNTFVGYPENSGSWGIDVMSSNYVTTYMQIQNNIFAYQENGLGSFYIRNSTTNDTSTYGNNCVYRSTGTPSRAADPGDVWNQNPLFANYSSLDFSLQSSSPCIDAGANLSVSLDYSGTSRPQGSGYDIGAYEYVSGGNPPILTSISIGDSSGFTNDTTPTITITSSNSPSHVAFSCNGGTNWGSWITYANSISSFNITSGTTGCNTTNGTKTITAKLKNTSDEESSTANDSTYYDNTAPSGGLINIRDGNYLSNSVGITLTDGSDGSGSGINTSSRIVQRKSATLTGSTCGSYGSFGTVTPSGTYPNMTDSTVTSGNCYQYQYYVSDNLGNQALYNTSNTAKVDSVAPSVTINQAVGQSDPTTESPIDFTVVFSESVSNFATGDVALSGTAGATTATVTGSGTTYNVAVSGMSGVGTVIASINAGVASDALGNSNGASTSSDNTVNWTVVAPILTSITIGDSTGYTNDSTPTISISSSNSPSHVAFSCNGGTNWSSWITYADTISTFNITSGATGCNTTNETKTITAKLKNSYNDESSTASDSTYYDNTAPSGGSINVRDGNYLVNSVGITLTDGSDGSGSGINTATRIVQRKAATLTAGTCGVYGSFATISPSGAYPDMTDSTVTSGNCYMYQYLLSDNLGNGATYTTSNVAKIDSVVPTTPGTPVSTPSSPTNQTTQSWSWTASTDSSSGISNYLYRTTGTSIINGSTNTNNVGTSLVAGTYTFYVKAVDNFGNESAESQANITIDTTAPTVTINQAVGQSDPTTESPIDFTVVFSESVSNFATGDVALSGTAGATTATVTGSGTTYNVAVSGMTGVGTVIAEINSGVATDSAGNTNDASTSSDNQVSWTVVPPTLTSISIGDSSGFTNDTTPTISIVSSGSPTHVAFSCDGGSNWTAWIGYANTISSFDMTTGATGCSTTNETKTITAKLKNINNDESSTTNDSTYFDNTAPSGGSIDFENKFYAITSVDLTLTDGSDGSGSGINTATRIVQRKSATLTSGTCGAYSSYSTITPIGIYPDKTDSTVVSGNCYIYQYLLADNLGNLATYTTSNVAKIDTDGPTTPGTPTSTPTSPTNQTTQSWSWNASSDNGSGVASYSWRTTGTSVNSGSSPTNSVDTSLTAGSYIFYVKAVDNLGNESAESQANITIDTTAPTVTINQAVGQSDPTYDSPVNFTVVFSESVTGFSTGEVVLGGSANPTDSIVSGSGTTYNVSVSGMSTSGTVSVNINAGVATDSSGNGNEASTSTDNEVTWNIVPPTLTSISIGDSSGFTNDTTPIISIVSSGSPTHVAFSCDAGTNWSSWIVYNDSISTFNMTSGTTGCSTTNETKTITAKLKNVTNDESSMASDSTYYDNTAPSGGDIYFRNGDYTVLSVGITLTDGSDGSGSGINTATRIVQRKSATLTAGTCGTYGSFATISPSGTYPDMIDSTVVSGNCYMYQYLLSDNLGNGATYSSSNEAKVQLTTYNLIYTTDGNGTIVGNASQTVNEGADGSEVTAMNNNGYAFLKWNDDSIINPRQDVGVTGNVSVMAQFIDSRTMVSPTPSSWINEVNSNFISTGASDPANTNSIVFNVNYYLNVGSGLVFFPHGTIVTKTGGGNFDMTKMEISNDFSSVQNPLARTIAIIKIGVTDNDLTFSDLVTISIPVGNNYNGQTLTTYYQNETSNLWNLGVNCLISAGTCNFQTNHATTYAVLENEASQNQSNSNNSNSAPNYNGVPSCDSAKPTSIPDLFQINTNNTTAKIFFTPVSNSNRYYISFSTKSNAMEHGADVTLAREGVQNFTISYLKPNTTYYIKVRGQNGCMPGEWSSIMKFKTRGKFVTKTTTFYKYNLIKSIYKKIIGR